MTRIITRSLYSGRRSGALRAVWLIALLSLVVVVDVRAAIVFDSATSLGDNSSEITLTHTTGAGLDRALVVGVSIFSATKNVVGITYGGAPLTLLGGANGGSGSNNRRTEIWYLVGPAVGTAPLVVTMSGGAKVVVGASTYFGVDPTTPMSGFVTAQSNGATASVTVASGSGQLVVDCLTTKGAAISVTPGAGQTQVWNDVTRTNGGNVMGAGSFETGASSVTMSWALEKQSYWVLGAASLLPAPPRPYVVDAMVKLESEAAAAYRLDAIYEPVATLQTVASGAVNGMGSVYHVRLENDGINPDQYVITGTAPDPAFNVQYVDGAGNDRTAAVTAAGYTDAVIAPGGSTVWTVIVTPAANTAGGTSFAVTMTSVSSGDPAFLDQVAMITASMSPSLDLAKNVDLPNAAPGEDLTYTIVATTAPGLSEASQLVVVDPVPAEVGLRVGSVTFDPGTTSLTATVQYSNDNGLTWTYTPGSGGCSGPAQYDYCVTHVRWEMTGSMPASQSFVLSFAGRVR